MTSIGSLKIENPVILAPMAGISDLPYRLIMKRFGTSLVFTEMISANGLVFNGSATRELLQSRPEERPLGIQLFGESAPRLAEAARIVADSGQMIDLNMGCPVKKVVRSGAGSALLRDPVKVGEVISAVRAATDLPLSVKIRSGWDHQSINYLEVARIAVEQGVDAICLHPRTRAQGFAGKADWSHIKNLKEAVSIPVIGSGDIFTPADAKTMFSETGCDAIMIGRGGYGNPWLIEQVLADLNGQTAPQPSTQARLRAVSDHLDLFLEVFGPKKTLGHMRKHLCWYVRGLENSAGFRAEINSVKSIDEMRSRLEDFFSTAT
jgi:nifR3 family TIM-barrel protein